jgi:hypothetical protein
MQLTKWPPSVVLLCAFGLGGCAHDRVTRADGGYRTEQRREVETLLAHPSPGNLATAALLGGPGSQKVTQSLELIEQAEALAPERPDLVWIELSICRASLCHAKEQIEAHLQALDPGNGFVWTPDLVRAQSLESESEITTAIMRIAASPRMFYYWNRLLAMTVDAWTFANPSMNVYTRGVYAIGLLSALAIPPLQPIAKACRTDQIDLPGRRAACEALAARMEQSDTVLGQMYALDVQRRWGPIGGSQGQVLFAKRRRLDYLLTISTRDRWWHRNKDMSVGIEAARRTDREQDVELTVIKSLGLPAEPPANWKDPLQPATQP